MLEIRDLHVKFNNRDREAVGGITLEIRDGEIVGLAGQSGSGKTVTAMSIAGLLPRKQCTYSGDILLNGQDLLHAPRSALRKLHGREVGVVFQDPMNAMDPLMRVGEQVGEVLRIHTNLSSAERREKALEAMASVELENPEKIYQSYPHELSGGMLQRAMIAAAIVIEPSLLLLDEPTTALISHNLNVMRKLCSFVAVMNRGLLVETGKTEDVYSNPQDPYTRQLIDAIPTREGRGKWQKN